MPQSQSSVFPSELFAYAGVIVATVTWLVALRAKMLIVAFLADLTVS